MLSNAKHRLNNSSEYLNKAILEIKEISCECKKDDDYCWRCCLLDNLIAQKNDIYQYIDNMQY